jgi:lipoyl(octanoyl) transferase
MAIITVSYLGKMEYSEALYIQEKLHKLRCENKIGDILLLVEHNSVLTLGRRGGRDNILLPKSELDSLGVNVFDVTRGGDVTYHGPGQIVGYPIFDLNLWDRDIKKFIWNIQKAFINLLKDKYNIIAHTDDKKYTGVWVDDKKVTAIGIAVKNSVTMHGFAFNVNTDLAHFGWINPCGITDKGVTSLEELSGNKQDMNELNNLVAQYFCESFDAKMELVDFEIIKTL